MPRKASSEKPAKIVKKLPATDYGPPMDKRLSPQPFKLVSRVRLPLGVPMLPWWNGIHASLRDWWEKSRVGSSPTGSTILYGYVA